MYYCLVNLPYPILGLIYIRDMKHIKLINNDLIIKTLWSNSSQCFLFDIVEVDYAVEYIIVIP